MSSTFLFICICAVVLEKKKHKPKPRIRSRTRLAAVCAILERRPAFIDVVTGNGVAMYVDGEAITPSSKRSTTDGEATDGESNHTVL